MFPIIYTQCKQLPLICRTASDLLEMKWVNQNESATDISSPFITPLERLQDLETSVLQEILEDFESHTGGLIGKINNSVPKRIRTCSSSLSSLRPVCNGCLWITPMFVGISTSVSGLEEAVTEASQRAIADLLIFLGRLKNPVSNSPPRFSNGFQIQHHRPFTVAILCKISLNTIHANKFHCRSAGFC